MAENVELRPKKGFEEIYNKLVEMKENIRLEIEKEFALRVEDIDKMIARCTEEVVVEAPVVEAPVVENNEVAEEPVAPLEENTEINV